MERSLHFYRDLLGLQVVLDTEETVGGARSDVRDPERNRLRAAYLRWDYGPDTTFIKLSQYYGETSGEAIRLDQVGIHHFSFWADDLQDVHEKLKAGGVPILQAPRVADPAGYPGVGDGKILTTLFRDPDGIIIQIDQQVNEEG